MLGLSATPYRRDGLSACIEWFMGPILHKIKPEELIKSGHITSIEVVVRRTNFNASMDDPSAEYSLLMKEISINEERNQMIADDVIEEAKKGEICLILSDRKIHCSTLKYLIELGLRNTNLKVELLTGDTLPGPRKKIVKEINNGKIQILVATGQLIGEGFDCKNLSGIFLTMPVRWKGRTIQYLGRVLRPRKGKDKAKVYDYFDESVRCLYSGFKARQTEYKKLGG